MDLKRTRWIRRLEDGTYTIESNSTLSNEKVLCSLCGIASKCNINETRLKLRDAGVTWRDRLTEGKIVCLVEADTAKILRFGVVDKVYSGPVDEMLRKHSRFNHLCMGGEKIEKVGEVIRRSYGHFLKEDSLLTAIYIRHIKRDFDIEYHSEEELDLVDPRPKAEVFSIANARQKLSDEP
ncbi:hypothetical protein [Klebsiella pneumoniae]|uniref:hypothetical protein n=1 Tax=Klebsiella pneumoniae TaxID=573 RepID=UPI00155558F5|nr:hypothetical protein [Klebsiella pneumoniae]